MIVVMSGCIVAVWLRNRDILRDMYDYSTVVVAAGKVEAGFKPYSGVRTPMQSSTYLLNYWTEQIVGRNYLSLTWGGLVQALGGALLLRWLLRRSLENGPATLVALALGLAGLGQHVVFFYNPIGILCLALVLFGVAMEPELRPLKSARSVVVLGALFLGGINKLNFQGAALALAGLLTLAAWQGGRITGRAFVRNGWLMAAAGLILPPVFEVVWSGTTFAQWWGDVVLLPQARQQQLGQIFDAGIYLRPVFESHHHLLVRPVGGIGLLFLLVAGGWMLAEARAAGRPAADWVARSLLLIAGAVFGGLLMTTNHETVMLTSLAYLVFGTAIYLLYRRPGQPTDRWMGRWVLAASLGWSVAGGYAAWHGSRVLYAPDPPPRSSYVRLDSPAPALAYFRGVRMLPDQIDALQRVAAKLQTLEDQQGRLPGMLFGPALEWLERAYPEAIVQRAPIWYDAGTSLDESDGGYFAQLLDGGKRRLITHQAWQAWPPAIWQLLGRDYRAEMIGSRDVMYHPRSTAIPPVKDWAADSLPADVYRDGAGGNVMIKATRYSGNMSLQAIPDGAVFGAADNTAWSWPLGARDLLGQAVAHLAPGAAATGTVTFRAIASGPTGEELLWETAAVVTPGRPQVVIPVALQPGGRALRWETEVTGPAGTLVGGWRGFRITFAGDIDHPPALPFGRNLRLVSSRNGDEELWYGRDAAAHGADARAAVPAENWRRYDPAHRRVEVAVGFEANETNPADPVVVTLAWYRAGRFEIMTEQMIDVRATPRVTLAANVPEPEGWVGLLTRPAGGTGAGHRWRVISWETR